MTAGGAGAARRSEGVWHAAARRFRGDRVLATFSTLVRPTVPLPYNIQVLTGIRPDDLARAPSIDAVKPGLLAFLGTAPLVAHTVSADVGCLARQGIVLQNRQVDTHLLASVVLPQMPGYSLSSGSVSPVLQAGANFRLTDAMVLTGGLTVNFTRNQLYQDGALQGTVKLSPVTFGLAVGYAF